MFSLREGKKRPIYLLLRVIFRISRGDRKFKNKDILNLTRKRAKKILKVDKVYFSLKSNVFFHIKKHIKDNTYVCDIFTFSGHKKINSLIVSIYSPGFFEVEATISVDERFYYY